MSQNVSLELGHLAAILAVMTAVIQAGLPLWVRADRARRLWLADFTVPLSLLQSALLCFAFFALMAAFVRSDFSVSLIYLNSHTLKPLLYKASALWGNHEGSLLLWLLVLALFGSLLALFGKTIDADLRFYALAVQSLTIVLFGLFMLLTSNPFQRKIPVPQEGLGFNPLLQDPGLAFHPPTLYMGYVGLSTVFSLAVAGLLCGRIDAHWAKVTRIFAMLAWLFLTAGIALGSVWAYYELGWGGFWFWDPVENSSLMPWLLTTALIHSLAVVQKSDALKRWTVFLSLMSFGLSLIGTFLVRSGIITSVHSFASDPQRGIFILLIILLMLVGGFTVYGLRGDAMQESKKFESLTREGFLIFNNVFLLTLTATVFLGTFYPLAIELVNGQRISVGAPYYNATFVPIMALCLLCVGMIPAIGWRRSSVSLLKARLLRLLPISFGFALAIAWLNHVWQLPALLGLLLGLWVILHAGFDIWRKAAQSAVWPMNLGHIGLGLVVIGTVVSTVASQEKITVLGVGKSVSFQNYEIVVQQLVEKNVKNYRTQTVIIEARHAGRKPLTLTPEKRFYPAEQQETTEASIKNLLGHDLYLSLGDIRDKNHIVVRAYYKPLISLIWSGSALLTLAGVLALLHYLAPDGVTRMMRGLSLSHKGMK